MGPQRGSYCLVDSSQAAIPIQSQAAIAYPEKILAANDHYRKEFLFRPQTEWPAHDDLYCIPIHLGITPG